MFKINYKIQIHYGLLECDAVLFSTHTDVSDEPAAPRRPGQLVCPKHQYNPTKPHGITSQKTL